VAAALVAAVVVLAGASAMDGDEAAHGLNLTGRWAFLQVTSQIGAVPMVGERTRTTAAFALVDMTQNALAATGRQTACFTRIEYGTSLVTMEIPEAFILSMPVVEWTAALGANEVGARFERPWTTLVSGAQLVDPENDPLPTEADDPRVIDQDGDGKPGLTVRVVVMGLIGGEVYVVQRDRSRLVGVVTSPDAIDGLVEWTSEQSVLGASSPAFLGGAAARPDPVPEHSFFRARRVDATMDCAALRGSADRLLDL